MSDFLKKFLLEDARRLSPSGRFVALAAFGKHPGWDDHIEDLGLETESLNFAKLLLYVNGIGGQIDSGAWEKLEEPQQLPGFKHVFVWQRAGQILVGRMWSSSDGKGRKRYPMVVCAHFTGVTLGWALKQALPVLAELEEGCVMTTSAEEVRSLLARKRAALREALQATDGKGEYAPVTPETLYATLNPSAKTKPEGFLRVLYQVESQLSGFAPGVFNSKSNPASVRVQQIRVPLASDTPGQALLFWSRFFLVYVDASVPLLLTLPLEAEWVDVTVGEPESHEMFCLRATPKAVPMVSEVPYKLEDDFRSKASSFLAGFQLGDITRPDLKTATTPIVPAAPPPRKSGWLRWLGIGSIVILGGIVAFEYLQSSSSETLSPNSSTTGSTAGVNGTNPTAADTARIAAANERSQRQADEEAERLADQKKKSDAVADAARLKAETEAAAKEKDRQLAETAAQEKQRLIAEAAALEKERQQAEAAAKEKQRQEAARKETERQQAAEAARLAAEKKAELAQSAESQQQKPVDIDIAALKTPAVDPSSATVGLVSAATSIPVRAGLGTNEMTNSIGMVLVLVPSGLWVGKYEVTQAEYKQVMSNNPSNSKWLNDRQPVEQVTWNEAVEFTRKLTDLERNALPPGKIYSLPTEKQWKEFVADQKFEDLPGATALRKEPSIVGQTAPANKLGLFDVLGNLWEWCLDDAPGEQKLLKGGAFNSNNYDRTLRPENKSLSCGFRCVLAPQENH